MQKIDLEERIANIGIPLDNVGFLQFQKKKKPFEFCLSVWVKGHQNRDLMMHYFLLGIGVFGNLPMGEFAEGEDIWL